MVLPLTLQWILSNELNCDCLEILKEKIIEIALSSKKYKRYRLNENP
jgi:hypothetical protein